jgi:threonine dehydratase
VVAARHAIADVALRSPVLRSRVLSDLTGTPVTLKLENLQVTGSFKVRGAANKLLALSGEEGARGVVTCSSGNHGKAVAYVADLLGLRATVCVPEWVDSTKLAAIKRHGAVAVLHGDTYDAAEQRSYEIQREQGLIYVNPFDDPLIIAGQGTIALELFEQDPNLDTLLVPLSGGGLIGGIALAMKSVNPNVQVVGVSATNARVMFESLKAGRPIAFPEDATVASALSGGVGLDNRYTFQLVQDYVDEQLLVTEDEIREAMEFAAVELKLVVEGGGAVGIAALLSGKLAPHGKHIAVVVSGGNIGLETLAEIKLGSAARR